MLRLLPAVLCVAGLIAPAVGQPQPAAESYPTWVKLADPPADLVGRECPPGMDGVWVYVPQWRGFLLYGGFSPSYTNEGWFFDPDRAKWTLLWADDSLAKDQASGAVRVLLPRQIAWTPDRPGRQTSGRAVGPQPSGSAASSRGVWPSSSVASSPGANCRPT